jgi:hypothetical protein
MIRLRLRLRRDWRRLRRYAATARRARQILITTGAVVIGGSSSLYACPVCFGAEETPLIDATKLGIVVLLTVTLSVQGAFVGFFFYLRRRAKRVADMDLDTEWSDLQGASRTP